MCTPMPPSAGGSLPAMDPYGKVVTAMLRPATLVLMGLASAAAIAHAFWAPFPASGGNPVLDLIAYHDPGFHTVIRGARRLVLRRATSGGRPPSPCPALRQPRPLGLESLARATSGGRRPGQAACLARVARGRGALARGRRAAPPEGPSKKRGRKPERNPRESERPSWLVIPETGLYTGILIVGAVGSVDRKTSACMYPFAQQLLSWQADWPARRASALVLEVKGDFCHAVRGILEEAAERADDYLEIGLGGAWQWEPPRRSPSERSDNRAK